MRVRYLGVAYGRPVVEINGATAELWIADMPEMADENTVFGMSIEGMLGNELFLEVTNDATGRMWRWKLDNDTGELIYRESKVAARRP